MLKRTFKIVRNKYLLSLVFLLTWLVFFDKNDLVSQVKLAQKLNKLTEEKDYYSSEIRNAQRELQELESNPKNLEKFAREKYLMKKDNEDIFVIVEE